MSTEASTQPGHPDLSQPPLEEIVRRCGQERSRYRARATPDSPWCVELFRRAFTEDEAAWSAIQQAPAISARPARTTSTTGSL